MADRARWADVDLEQELRELGAHLAYPATPPIARSVRERLVDRRQRAGSELATRWWEPLRSLRWGIAIVLLALALLGGIILALSPATRTAIADRLGLGGVRITHVPDQPIQPLTAVPDTGTGVPQGIGAGLRLGRLLTLPEAQALFQRRIQIPSLPELSVPDEVYVGTPPPGGQVGLVYRARPGLPPVSGTEVGLLLTEFRGDIEPGFFGKLVGPQTQVVPVLVDGWAGFWITGQAHLFFYRDETGQVRDESIRLAGNTLLWEREGLTLRLESALSRDEALRIAQSVR